MFTSGNFAHGIVVWNHDHYLITITGRCTGGDESATVEMTERDWQLLAPVRQAVEEERKRLHISAAPLAMVAADAVPALPRAHLERRQDQTWVILTACRAGGTDAVSLEIPWPQWSALAPIYWLATDGVRIKRTEPAILPPVGSAPAFGMMMIQSVIAMPLIYLVIRFGPAVKPDSWLFYAEVFLIIICSYVVSILVSLLLALTLYRRKS
jgi:hypothetical protein